MNHAFTVAAGKYADLRGVGGPIGVLQGYTGGPVGKVLCRDGRLDPLADDTSGFIPLTCQHYLFPGSKRMEA